MSSTMPGIPNFRGTPVLVLRRTAMLRILLGILMVPAALAAGAGAVACFVAAEPELVGGAILAVLAILLAGGFAWLALREASREIRLYEDGIEQVTGGSTRAIRWSDVQSIEFRSVRAQAGGLFGLVGLLVRYAAEKAIAPRPGAMFDERVSNITAKIIGRDGKITLTSNDHRAGPALDEAMRRVNPRLIEEHLSRLHGADSIAYGKIVVSRQGIAFGARPVPFSDVENLKVANGQLVLKCRGKLLRSTKRVAKVPNVLVLLEVFRRVSGQAVDGVDGKSLAESRMHA